jgi:hypothetical protein
LESGKDSRSGLHFGYHRMAKTANAVGGGFLHQKGRLRMERTPVESSNLFSVGYDAGTSTLEIEFRSGGVYQYFGVPAGVCEGLMMAPSKGRYFDQYIKKAGYPYSRVG